MNWQSVLNFFNNPKTLLIIIFLFAVAFFLSDGFIFGFGNNFLAFGPTTESNGQTTHFMGIPLDTWKKVGLVYVIIFLSCIMQSYYNIIASKNIRSYIFSPSIINVPYNKFWTYSVMLLNPIIRIVLYVITFFATATFQVQYILPQLLAETLMNLPFTLMWLNKKKFIN
jgi:hypothetical protein